MTQNWTSRSQQRIRLILGWRPTNERRRYFVTMSLIDWTQTSQPTTHIITVSGLPTSSGNWLECWCSPTPNRPTSTRYRLVMPCRSQLTLIQVMAWCLTASSHYLNQCWLIISMVVWFPKPGNFKWDTSATNYQHLLENYLSKILSQPLGNQWVRAATIHTIYVRNPELFLDTPRSSGFPIYSIECLLRNATPDISWLNCS